MKYYLSPNIYNYQSGLFNKEAIGCSNNNIGFILFII